MSGQPEVTAPVPRPAPAAPVLPALAVALATTTDLESLVQTRPDGTRVEYRPDGTPARQWNPDGSILTYDQQGLPAVETLVDGTTITFHADGTSTESLPDGTTFDFDASGKALRESTPDGTTFSGFDGDGRPTRGVLPGGSAFSLTYDAKGDTFERFADGSEVETDSGGHVVRQVTPDGTTFTSFDGTGRPTAGVLAGGGGFTIRYDARGDAIQTFDDGTVVQTDPNGRVIREVTPDGTVFTSFDGSGRPTAGTSASGQGFTLTYDAHGDTFEHLGNGAVIETDPGGRTIREVTPDGTVFTAFDGQGRPTDGTTSDGHHFTITYDSHGDSFEHLDDGTVVETDPQGHPIRTWTPEGVEITWAVDIPALNAAIGQVSAERDSMKDAFANLRTTFTDVESIWDSPAGMSFHPLADSFNTVTQSLLDLLDDAIDRMRAAYHNYVDTENTNVGNLH